jgi:glyoxylase-like metal-dependent hydrolase (beta-lactamase superfamily II)
MTGKSFASTGDNTEKRISFTKIGPGLFAYTAEGDPNTGIIVGDDCCMVIDAQATPQMASDVIQRVRAVTPKPIRYVLLTHYHAVRVLGASAYEGAAIIASEATRKLILERGEEDMASEIGRFPRLFRGTESIPGLTWPTITFTDKMTVYLGKRRVDIFSPGRGHTAGDTVAYVPDYHTLFSGDLIEYRSACYCGDAFLEEWPSTIHRLAQVGLRAIVPGRGDALTDANTVTDAIDGTTEFIETLFHTARLEAQRGASLKETFAAVRKAMDGPFGRYAIYEHCLPFNVSRAYDEARGIEWPRIWTAERDQKMWAELQG